jgi:hypothetical protein
MSSLSVMALRSPSSVRLPRVALLLGALFVASSLSFARSAQATPEYPSVIDSTLGVECPLPNQRCLMCHTTARGGQTTAVQPFAQTLRRFGLVRGYQDAALIDALNRLPDDTNSDPDTDSIPDREELLTCGNPSGADLGDGPQYGCDGAHLARRASTDVPSLLLSITLAGLLVRARRVVAGSKRAR